MSDMIAVLKNMPVTSYGCAPTTLSSLYLKDDFQAVLRTLESLFKIFVFTHVRCHKMWHFDATFRKQIQRGKALFFVLSDIARWNTYFAVKIKETAKKNVWDAKKINNNVDSRSINWDLQTSACWYCAVWIKNQLESESWIKKKQFCSKLFVGAFVKWWYLDKI